MADEKDVQDNLTLEDPKPVEDPKADIDGLLAQLESAGITDTTQLENKLTASSQAGNAFRKLGDANKRIEALEAAETERRQNKPAPDWDQDYPGNTEVDLEATISKVWDKKENEKLEKQYNANQWVMDQQSKITQDIDYPMVKEVWEAKIADPQFSYKVNTGQIVPFDVYSETVRTFYKGIAKKAHSTISELTGQKKPVTPNVETDQVPTANILSEGENEDNNAKLKAKVDKGYIPNEQEEMAALDAMLNK